MIVMPFCRYCGKEIAETDGFCPHCGKPAQAVVTSVELHPKEVERCATLAERFLAVLVDTILLAIATAIIMIPFGIIALVGNLLGSPLGWFFSVPAALWFLLWVLYFTYFESTSGQTIGKRMMAIKVVTENNTRVNVTTALIRNILRIIDWLPVFYIIGVLLVATTAKKQRLGDLLAKTIVVKV